MCGIVGINSLNKSKIPNLKSRIKKMIDMINYRGPDNKGFYFNENENFGMANNQLSIVSIRQKIKLPLSYDKKNHLSFNGEIYNYLNLRQKYKVPNKYFIHKTDTEILYYLLNQTHFDLSELNGMWYFAHYNSERHVLKIGRDILGERNLYYYVNKNELIFSSEIRPIFAANKLSFSVDNIGLQDMWKYYTCRDNLTIIKNCFKLTPGTYITFKNKDDCSISEKSIPILSLENNYDLLKGKTLKFAEKKFKELLYDELKLRLPNKVKSFSQLSGYR